MIEAAPPCEPVVAPKNDSEDEFCANGTSKMIGNSELVPLRFDAAKLATKTVVVYSDRADVRRELRCSLRKGTNHLLIENVSAVMERESVRVDGLGVVHIHEVQYREAPMDPSEHAAQVIGIVMKTILKHELCATKLSPLETEKERLEDARSRLDDEMESLRRRCDVLDGVAAQIGQGGLAISVVSASGEHHRHAENADSLLRRSSTTSLLAGTSGTPVSGGGERILPSQQPRDCPVPATAASSQQQAAAAAAATTQTSLLQQQQQQLSTTATSGGGAIFTDEALANLSKFLAYYGETVAGWKAELRQKSRESERLTEQLDALDRRIDQLRSSAEYDSIERCISVVVEADRPEPSALLLLSYVVYCAGWRPVYDIRASTADECDVAAPAADSMSMVVVAAEEAIATAHHLEKATAGGDGTASEQQQQQQQVGRKISTNTVASSEKMEPRTVRLSYYGLVEQNTGEDWLDAELILSTAAPSAAGHAPSLATLAATLKRRHSGRERHGTSSRRRGQPNSAASEDDAGFGSYDYNEVTDAAALQRLQLHHQERGTTAAPSAISDSVSSTESLSASCASCFAVPRACSIRSASGATEHKVLVQQLDLAAAYFHDAVPSRAAAAFLSAAVTNTSSLPLLPGPVAVYLNGAFVGRTNLRFTAPDEEFRVQLGVDPAVKVEYRPPSRHLEPTGFMSRYTLATHERRVVVRNAHAHQSVQITIREQIPKPVDEKIKVNLLTPKSEARLNKDNNLEWTSVLASGQTKELVVRYTLEYPLHEVVAFKFI